MTKIVNFTAKKAELNKRCNEVELAKAAGCEGQVISEEIKEESTRESGKVIPFPRPKVSYIETCAGIGATSLALKEVGEKLGIDFYEYYKSALDKYISLNLIEKTEKGFRLSEKGIEVSNYILSDFVNSLSESGYLSSSCVLMEDALSSSLVDSNNSFC